jgi:hypothetical protein
MLALQAFPRPDCAIFRTFQAALLGFGGALAQQRPGLQGHRLSGFSKGDQAPENPNPGGME